MRRRAAGRLAPTLRLAGGGTFPYVLWMGVQTRDDRLFRQLAKAAGVERDYRPHLTVARWRSGTADNSTLAGPLTAYSGPWFIPTEFILFRSENHTYTTVERLPLAHE